MTGAIARLGAQPIDFPALYEAELTHVWHTLRRCGVQERDLEDLCHDVFVAFYVVRDRYDPARPIKPWLSGIAFRVASDYRRRAGYRRELPGVEHEPPASTTPRADELIAARQEQDLVIASLTELDDDRRAVLVMHDLDGCSMPIIAEALGLRLNTAYSRLRLARADFAAAVRRRQHPRRTP